MHFKGFEHPMILKVGDITSLERYLQFMGYEIVRIYMS